MENKRVTAIAVLMAAVFVYLCYYGYGQYNILQEAQKEISQNRIKVEDYANQELPPTRENKQLLEQAANQVGQITGDLRQDLKNYADFCQKTTKVGDKSIDPAQFQKAMNDMTAQLAAYAREKKCALSPEAASLGLAEYKTQAVENLRAPYLNFMLRAADQLTRHVIDSGAPAIKKVYCGPLPESEITARKQSAYFPLEVEISFAATPGQDIDPKKEDSLSVLPQVINRIISDKNYFFIITGVSVRTVGNLPNVSAYNENSEETPEEASTGPDTEISSESIATLITGKPSEQVNVSLTLQVFYFTTTDNL